MGCRLLPLVSAWAVHGALGRVPLEPHTLQQQSTEVAERAYKLQQRLQQERAEHAVIAWRNRGPAPPPPPPPAVYDAGCRITVTPAEGGAQSLTVNSSRGFRLGARVVVNPGGVTREDNELVGAPFVLAKVRRGWCGRGRGCGLTVRRAARSRSVSCTGWARRSCS